MAKNFIFIDFENVQPGNLHLLKDVDTSVAEFNILVFVGAKQATIPFDFAEQIQNMGSKAEYIKCSVTQKNAADFLLSYHLGRLIQSEPEAYFHIISKDTGFDSLVLNLREQNQRVQRHKDIYEISVVSKHANLAEALCPKASINHLETVIANLKGRGASKPRKVKTLKSTIANLIKADPSAKSEKIFNTMVKRKVVIVEGEKVSYNL